MWNGAVVKKSTQTRVIPTNDVVFLGQVKDHAIHFRYISLKPGVGDHGRENARTGSIEIVFLENGLDGFHAGIDVTARGARSPPIVFGHHNGSFGLHGRAKIGGVDWRALD